MNSSPNTHEASLKAALSLMGRHSVIDGIGAGPLSERGVVDLVLGGVSAVNWTVGGAPSIASWVHWPLAGSADTFRSAFLNMLLLRWLARRLPDKCILVRTVSDIEQAKNSGRVGIIQGWQGADPVEENLHFLEIFHEFGLRIVQVMLNSESSLGFGCMEPDDRGLKYRGRLVVAACNDLGLVVDLSHAGERTARDILERSAAPCIFSHSNPKAVCDHPRNISDDLIKACAGRGGVVGCNVFSDFVSDTSTGRQPSVDDWVRCVQHVVELVGIDHVGIGTDLCMHPDGAFIWDNSSWGGAGKPFNHDEVEGMAHTHRNFPSLVAGLLRRGYEEADLAKILGLNWIRVFGQAWKERLA